MEGRKKGWVCVCYTPLRSCAQGRKEGGEDPPFLVAPCHEKDCFISSNERERAR
jgi:hypothetical protein